MVRHKDAVDGLEGRNVVALDAVDGLRVAVVLVVADVARLDSVVLVAREVHRDEEGGVVRDVEGIAPDGLVLREPDPRTKHVDVDREAVADPLLAVVGGVPNGLEHHVVNSVLGLCVVLGSNKLAVSVEEHRAAFDLCGPLLGAQNVFT